MVAGANISPPPAVSTTAFMSFKNRKLIWAAIFVSHMRGRGAAIHSTHNTHNTHTHTVYIHTLLDNLIDDAIAYSSSV